MADFDINAMLDTMPSHEEVMAEHRARWDEPCHMSSISLVDWITAANEAGVPNVPLTMVARPLVESIMLFDDDENLTDENRQELSALATALKVPPDGRRMRRWDCCSGHGTKWAMDSGPRQHCEATWHLDIDDPRFFDILWDYKYPRIPVWERPWVDARYVGTHPVEFRAFVYDNRVFGVSNYYPQRALPDDVETNALAFECARLAQQLTDSIAAYHAPGFMHQPGNTRTDTVCATMDFIVTDREVLFLEGGPPFGRGADPCCFDPERGVHGIALAAQWNRFGDGGDDD